MADRIAYRWQSLLETIAIVAIAVAVVWTSLGRPGMSRAAAATPPRVEKRAEAPLPKDPITLQGAQRQGSDQAKVALIVYSDFQCPFCARFARDTMPAIQDQYVKTGKVLIAFRQFPLPIHEHAQKASEAAICAGRQGKFWLFHDALFRDQNSLDETRLIAIATQVGADSPAFRKCLEGAASEAVKEDSTSGSVVGVEGTPTFLVGILMPDGRVKVTERFSGALPLSDFQSRIDRVVAAAGR